MEEITDLNKLRKIVDKGARGWQPSDMWPRLYFWNTTGREHRIDFPTIYASRELLEKTSARIASLSSTEKQMI